LDLGGQGEGTGQEGRKEQGGTGRGAEVHEMGKVAADADKAIVADSISIPHRFSEIHFGQQ
jgi:hypothetical protein